MKLWAPLGVRDPRAARLGGFVWVLGNFALHQIPNSTSSFDRWDEQGRLAQVFETQQVLVW